MSEDTPVKRFDFQTTPIAGLMIAQRNPIEDHRGFFSRFFCADEFFQPGLKKSIAQINHTFTRNRGAVRGLHFQYPPHAEVKIVSCLKGEIFDVAVDIRKGSPTFLRWHGEILSAANKRSLLIPEGFAHGFQALSENCEVIYLVSASFHPQSEGALNVTDTSLGIIWPLVMTETSEKDKHHSFIDENFEGVTL
ncbi:MAG: dTDP-4-dehydrorhamnose 3,5-epimerase [Syntrophus sp. (in: bacteria)]|nr:dTDP-4-dehydrorhamnose 3,5-epimerase [Syntrophus sp. (in: bacteria)]